MGLKVVSLEDHVLTTCTPLTGNTNIHDTAFAGSLYSALAMTAWGLLYLEIEQAGINASIIHASGEIEFAHTVQEDIVASAGFAGCEHHIETLRRTGKTRLNLTSTVSTASGIASRFTGLYLARQDN